MLSVLMFLQATGVYDAGENTVSRTDMLQAITTSIVEFQNEIKIIANILTVMIAILLGIKFIGDCIYVSAAQTPIGSTHDQSWAYKGILKTVVFMVLDGAAWVITNIVIRLAIGM